MVLGQHVVAQRLDQRARGVRLRRVVGMALNTATVAALFTEVGETDATPCVPATPLVIELSSDWSPSWTASAA